MEMKFCRGCAKEIHETAESCPACGAPQGLQINSKRSRNTGVLIVVACGWTLIMWMALLFFGGIIVGAMNPDNPGLSGEQFGKAASLPVLLISGIASALFTKMGMLPGTRKNA